MEYPKTYGITADGIGKAVQAAKGHFRTDPNDTIILEFDEGTFNIEGKNIAEGSIDRMLLPPLLERIAQECAQFTWPVNSDDVAEEFHMRKRGHGTSPAGDCP